jgi:hypothetical protein
MAVEMHIGRGGVLPHRQTCEVAGAVETKCSSDRGIYDGARKMARTHGLGHYRVCIGVFGLSGYLTRRNVLGPAPRAF